MNSSVIKLIEENKNVIIESWLSKLDIVREKETNLLDNISDSVYRNTCKEFVEILMVSLSNGQELFSEELSDFTDRLIHVGWPLSYLTRGLQTFRRETLRALVKNDDGNNIEMFHEVGIWLDEVVNILVDKYSGSWENTVFLQKMALKELSAPLIPVFENISVMPLIGTIDTERAKLIMESLLNGVIKNRSQVVLIDITGVPVVDTMVANHIIQACEAVRLVSAESILVGIRPEIAQTIVNLGIDLTNIPTKNTLKRGIEKALEKTQKKIVKLED